MLGRSRRTAFGLTETPPGADTRPKAERALTERRCVIITDESSETGRPPTDGGISASASASLFAAFEEELALKSTLLDSMLDGVLAHTLDGLIVYVNAPACRIYGIAQEDFVNLAPWAWVREPMRSSIADRIGAIRRQGGLVFESFGLPDEAGEPMRTEVHARIVDTANHGEIVISVVRDISERHRAEQRMRHLAFHDILTGLPNRVTLEDRMRASLAESDRHGDIVGVIYVDLDDFKPVNDAHGHAIGDQVLCLVADRLVSGVREGDTVARLGGDEFVVLLPRVSTCDDLATIAAGVSDRICEPIVVEGHVVRVTASVGLACYELGEAPDELLTRADHAMYRAKQHGLKGWEEFSATLQ